MFQFRAKRDGLCWHTENYPRMESFFTDMKAIGAIVEMKVNGLWYNMEQIQVGMSWFQETCEQSAEISKAALGEAN